MKTQLVLSSEVLNTHSKTGENQQLHEKNMKIYIFSFIFWLWFSDQHYFPGLGLSVCDI